MGERSGRVARGRRNWPAFLIWAAVVVAVAGCKTTDLSGTQGGAPATSASYNLFYSPGDHIEGS